MGIPQRHSTSPRSKRETIRLLVKELTSAALTCQDAEQYDQTFVVAQLPGELPVRFALRTIQRLATLERSGHRVSCATFLAGLHSGPGVAAARRSIALALMQHQSNEGVPGGLVIEALAGVDEGARRELLSLVDDVLCSTASSPVPVRLRFAAPAADTAPPKSGVFPRISALAS